MRARDRLFRLVLRLYPAEFRDRFGDDMAAAYREARMEAAMRGRRGVAEFWRGVAADALIRAPGEHLRMTLHDLRYAARALRRTPMYTLVAIATLALGIGGNTAIFSVVHAVALQPLPGRDPDRLVRVSEKNDALRIPRFSVSVPYYYSWRERATSFESMATWRDGAATIMTGGDPVRLSTLKVTWTFLPMLGVAPIAGRAFVEDEDRRGAAPVVILAESIWRSQFGGDPAMLGKPIVLDDIPHTVVGIVADRDLFVPTDAILPLAADLANENRSNHLATVIARLKPGVTLRQAQDEMDAIAVQLGKEYPKDDAGWGVAISTAYDSIVPEQVRTSLYVVLLAVVVVLLIACTNIANLALARAALHRRERAVRLALGATGARIVRDVLAESL